jgi:hypothetical protein
MQYIFSKQKYHMQAQIISFFTVANFLNCIHNILVLAKYD